LRDTDGVHSTPQTPELDLRGPISKGGEGNEKRGKRRGGQRKVGKGRHTRFLPPPDMKSWIKPWAVVITPPLQLMMTPSVYDKFSSTWT